MAKFVVLGTDLSNNAYDLAGGRVESVEVGLDGARALMEGFCGKDGGCYLKLWLWFKA